MATEREQFANAIRHYAADFGLQLNENQIGRLTDYHQLLLKWNERLHLVAPCAPSEFAVRHVLESLLALRHLPASATMVDVGSGGGLPAVPCLLVREDLSARLIEASHRKAVFLREVLRAVTPVDRAQVLANRFEEIDSPAANVLTCRALDRFSDLLPDLIQWANPGTRLLLFAGAELRAQIEAALPSIEIEKIPHSQKRFLIIGHKPEP